MRRALIIGINHYKNAPLKGCIKDAEKINSALATHEDGSPNFDCKLLTSSEDAKYPITVAKLKKNIHNLFHQEAEIAVLYFSGHGATNDIGSYIVTQDAHKYNEGVSLQEIITMANTSKVKEAIIILDACHSGQLGNSLEFGNRKAVLREGVSVLSSSRDTQYSVERNGSGLFTTIIYEAMNGGASDILGNITVAGIYYFADQLLNSWEQRPVFKSHISKMASLRYCPPKIPLEILRELPVYFEEKEQKLQLNPLYEASISPRNEVFEEIMKHLRMFHTNGLLLPVDTLFMYDAAKDSKACELTSLGKFYWDLVSKKQL
ncbi:caspase family protein [Aquimarina sp. RZ0]|uniref:caspase family protein n=1 Tax=Aquimarina sp. RZ0 TaxID=2607730 RepID=UPI0011F2AAAB|nr:caspase family protein [Aquimarina sp. RZ0]KAA1245866.1 caspase family protein [Aquimarina sp. RZ0]